MGYGTAKVFCDPLETEMGDPHHDGRDDGRRHRWHIDDEAHLLRLGHVANRDIFYHIGQSVSSPGNY
jgi:hypothetical protein